jgi:glycosyltransferase involved in cell wall biosynthesis
MTSSGDDERSRYPLRILHVLPDLDMGGGQQVLRRALDEMEPARFEHVICYFEPNHEMRSTFEAIGAKVEYIPFRGWWSWPRTLFAVASLIRGEAIDVVHINGTPIDKLHGQISALATGRPVVSTLHGPRFRPGQRWPLIKHRVRETAEHLLDPMTTRRVVAVSDSVMESWRPYLESRHVPRSRMLINQNGVPTTTFDREANQDEVRHLRASLGIEGLYPILITVGRLDRNKSHHFMIPMMERIREKWPDAKLYIIGEGPLEGEIRGQIAAADLSDAIVLLGRRADVSALLGMADVFVFSSLSEGLPLAVLEAMAASLPIVSFRLPGLDPVMEEGRHGFQVEPKDWAALAAKVLQIVEDRELAEAMGKACRAKVVTDYDVSASVRCLERVYEEAASS